MKDYADIEHIIIHFLQKEISEEEMKLLIEWLNNSPANKESFFRLKKIYDQSNKKLHPDTYEIEKNKKRLLDTIKREEKINRQNQLSLNRKKRLYALIKYAAVAMIVFISTIAIQYIAQKDTNNFIELDVESGPRMSHMTLPDGTKVILNASSKIKFPEKFSPQKREIFLDGEAFFEVIQNKKSPFVVHTNKQRIEVLGTKFNVMDYAADDYSITTLIGGKIKMQSIAENGELGDYIYLKPNQQVFFNNKTKQLALSDIKVDTKRTWVNKVYHFRAEPLLLITKRLEKIYGIKINIINDELKKVEYTGTFGLDQEIETVLKIINFDKQFSYSINEHEIVIQ